MDRKKVKRMGWGIFIMLAIGTLPVVFMNPIQYFCGLVVCCGLSFVLAIALT